jgi:glycosyltransferase involved in cell wall biosynthesis
VTTGARPPRRPSVLVVAQRLPLPVRGGGDLRVLQMLTGLSASAEVGLVALTPASSARWPPVPLALCHAPPADGHAEDPAQTVAWLGLPAGHPSDRWWTAGAESAVEWALERLRPQVVVLEHLWTHRAAALARRARCLVVLDAHNAEGRLHLQLAHSAGPGGGLPELLARRTLDLEGRAVAAVDQVWVPSHLDADDLRRRYPSCAPVHVVPNTVALPAARPRVGTGPAPLRPGPTVLLPGSFGYPPNAAGAAWMVEEVMPLVRGEVPGASLVLAGSGPTAALRRLADMANVSVTGEVDDMAGWFAGADVVVVPVFAGGGTRFKVLEAFAAGVPVVSTPAGTAGLEAEAGRHHLQAADASSFAQCVVTLWRAPEVADRLAAEARRLVNERYSGAVAAAAIAEAMAALLEDGARLRRRTPRGRG